MIARLVGRKLVAPFTKVGRKLNSVGSAATHAREAPVPMVTRRPRSHFGPAYALEFRVSPNVWIVKPLHC